ncbi:hypothetical protein D6855_12375 [Butyrivibrio sp. CB08]|uniref:hypothetical protein n=1 Tax=Butyrivibrio sp. CB08 TaxID=2364879 RepID=UPI000EA90F47|nr:hypothetical protein [Butyrivibrio sp. CB08]RKM57839.1 hypothetical protein D6855_12375 [Butyrivibrio sp. CB08]
MFFKSQRIKRLVVIEAILLFISLMLFCIPLRHYSYSIDGFQSDGGVLLEGLFDVTESGIYIDNAITEEKGTMTDGTVIPWATVTSPATDLRFGSYNIIFKYLTSDHNNTYSCSSLYNTIPVILLRENMGLNEISDPDGRMVITLNSALNVDGYQVLFNYTGNGYLYVYGMEIQETNWWKFYILFWLLTVSIVVDLFIYLGEKKGKYAQGSMVVIFALAILSSLPLFDPYLVTGHDCFYHLARIEALVTAIQNGQFPVRVSPVWINGQGYASSIFYNDLFMLLPAGIRLLGASIQFAFKIYVFCINLLTAAIAVGCFSKLFNKKISPFVAGVIYVLAPYRITCLYTRSAVGEYTAITFLPLVFYGLMKIYKNEESDRKITAKLMRALPLALGVSGVVSSHVVSCVIVFIFAVIFAVMWYKKTFTVRVLTDILCAVAIVLMINMWYFVPFIQVMADGIGSAAPSFDGRLRSNGTYLWQLLSLFSSTGISMSIEEAVPMARGAEMTVGIGPAYFALILYAVLRVCGIIAKEKDKNLVRYIDLLCVAAVISLIMETPFFPWDGVKRLSSITNMVAQNIRFPFRFIGVSMLCLALISGYLFEILDDQKEEIRRYAPAFVGAIFIGTFISASYTTSVVGSEVDHMYIPDDYNSFGIMGAEYLPIGIAENYGEINEPIGEDGIDLLTWNKEKGSVKASVTNTSSSEKLLEVPFIYYRGYRAKDSKGNNFIVVRDSNAFVSVVLPAGYSGEITVYYKESVLWRISEIVSFLSVIGLICLARYTYVRNIHGVLGRS